jgi:hypothetical protein
VDGILKLNMALPARFWSAPGAFGSMAWHGSTEQNAAMLEDLIY